MRGKSFGQWLGFLVILAVLASVGTISSISLFSLANYSDTVGRLVFALKNEDTLESQKEIENLHYFYDLSKQWKLQWLVDKHLFDDSLYYQVEDSYIIGNWEEVVRELKDLRDDPRSYPYGHAMFRQLQAQYQKGQKKEAMDQLDEIALEFEKDLRNCLSVKPYNDCYDRVWNYDLVTNKKDGEQALAGTKPAPKFMLGPKEDKKAPPKMPGDRNKKGDGKEGEEEKGGSGGPRKRP